MEGMVEEEWYTQSRFVNRSLMRLTVVIKRLKFVRMTEVIRRAILYDLLFYTIRMDAKWLVIHC